MLQLSFDQADNAPNHRLDREDPNRHLGKLVLNGPKLRNRGTESLAFLRIFQTKRQHLFCSPESPSSELQTAYIKDVECDDVTAPDLAQYVFDGNFDIVKVHGCGGAAFHAHLVFFSSAGYSGEPALDKKGGELFSRHF